MAIRTMTTREAYEADPRSETNPGGVELVTAYPGHEAGRLDHGRACSHYTQGALDLRSEGLYPDCVTEGSFSDRCRGPMEPLYMETTHVGLVLDTGEYNGYDDSDFYAVVWNAEKGTTERVEYASTRGWTYPNSAVADATPEVVAAFLAYQDRVRASVAQAREEAVRKAEADKKAEIAALEEQRRAAEALVGKRVLVLSGKEKGAQGTVAWAGVSRYAKRPTGRVSVLRADGTRIFVAVREVREETAVIEAIRIVAAVAQAVGGGAS